MEQALCLPNMPAGIERDPLLLLTWSHLNELYIISKCVACKIKSIYYDKPTKSRNVLSNHDFQNFFAMNLEPAYGLMKILAISWGFSLAISIT